MKRDKRWLIRLAFLLCWLSLLSAQSSNQIPDYMYPVINDTGRMSIAAYGNDRQLVDTLRQEGWGVPKLIDFASGLHVGVWERSLPNGNRERVVAFVGTKDLAGVAADISQGAVGPAMTAQYRDGLDFALRQVAEKDRDPRLTVTFTGHSLGGSIGERVNLETGVRTVVFNAAPLNELDSLFAKDRTGQASVAASDLWNLRSRGDIVSALPLAKQYGREFTFDAVRPTTGQWAGDYSTHSVQALLDSVNTARTKSAASSPIDQWTKSITNDVIKNDLPEHILPSLKVQPEAIDAMRSASREVLQIATAQRDYNTARIWSYAAELGNAKSSIDSARLAIVDLEGQLKQARIDGLTPPARISEMEANLKSSNSAVRQASDSLRPLEFRLASAKSDLWQAESNIRSAQRALFVADRIVPRFNSALDFASRNWGAVDIASDVAHLMRTPADQRADASFTLNGVFLKSLSFAGRDALWAEYLGGPVLALRQTLRDTELTSNAYAYHREAQSLAMGGALSGIRPSGIRFGADSDQLKGSFHSLDASNRVSIAGGWNAYYGDRTDLFTTWSKYDFHGQNDSGGMLSGTGRVFRERSLLHDQFQNEPLLSWMSRDSVSIERTSRSESYHYSFDGRQANENIRMATDHVLRPEVPGVAASLSPPSLYENEGPRQKSSIFLPPPSPPRPQSDVFTNLLREGGLSSQVGARTLFPATLSEQKVGGVEFLKPQVDMADDRDFSSESGSQPAGKPVAGSAAGTIKK